MTLQIYDADCLKSKEVPSLDREKYVIKKPLKM